MKPGVYWYFGPPPSHIGWWKTRTDWQLVEIYDDGCACVPDREGFYDSYLLSSNDVERMQREGKFVEISKPEKPQ